MEEIATPETITITEEELKSLTEAIMKRHGIDFSCYETKSLTRRIVRVLHRFQFTSIHELWIRILKDQSFIYPFMDEVSVGLTSMFRDPVLWRSLKTFLGTAYRTKPGFNIWHAGCSTGEEVYTMAIVLREAGLSGIPNVWATDISQQSLETARQGIYHELKLQEFADNYSRYNPNGMLRSYGALQNGEIKFPQDLLRNTVFEYHNLIVSPFTRKFDVILCRNVMIYFDNAAKKKLFEKFHQALHPGGLLIIGFYDAILPLIDPGKFEVYDMDAKIFRKVG